MRTAHVGFLFMSRVPGEALPHGRDAGLGFSRPRIPFRHIAKKSPAQGLPINKPLLLKVQVCVTIKMGVQRHSNCVQMAGARREDSRRDGDKVIT